MINKNNNLLYTCVFLSSIAFRVEFPEDNADKEDVDLEQGHKPINGLPSLELSKELQLGFKSKHLLPGVFLEEL